MYHFLLALLLAAPPGLTIRVNPQAILVSQSLWLTCRVTPDAMNRKLVYGVVGSEQENTERQLDGYNARITWGPIEIKRIPCDAGPAYCAIFKADGSVVKATAPLTVGGCDQ